MSATKFKCPNNDTILIEQCLRNCPRAERCIAKPTLVAIAESVKDRGLELPSVTELINGTRETYLCKTKDYAVSPADQIFALHGSAFHGVNENADDKIITEERFSDEICCGKIDCYGRDVLARNKLTLLDHKVTSSYKSMKALGYYKVDIPTGEVYKTGLKKGQPKTRKEWRTDGVKDVFEYALQLNYYRLLLEEQGYKVENMAIQLFVRDWNTRIATERNITKPVYLLKINKISNHWLKLWFKAKRERLDKAMATGITEPCNHRETWHGRKCKDYCAVAEYCHYGQLIKGFNPEEAKEALKDAA